MSETGKPAIHVRIVWPKDENNGKAVEAVGTALRRIQDAREMLGAGEYHFTLSVQHEAEEPADA